MNYECNFSSSIGERIVGETVDIDYSKVERFFEDRCSRNFKHKYNYVIYLDDNPDIAIQRDSKCKEKFIKEIELKSGMNVLDIGCGNGRWGEFFLEKGLNYVGIDASAAMIEKAKENLNAYNEKRLLVGEISNLKNILNRECANIRFDVILICGVLMYINDVDIRKVLLFIHECSHSNSQLCFIESLSEKD